MLLGQSLTGAEKAALDSAILAAYANPQTAPPGMVERAIEAAWPGGQAHVAETVSAGCR